MTSPPKALVCSEEGNIEDQLSYGSCTFEQILQCRNLNNLINYWFVSCRSRDSWFNVASPLNKGRTDFTTFSKSLSGAAAEQEAEKDQRGYWIVETSSCSDD